MGIDWGFAVQVGGVGFGFVFFVLVALAVSMWLTGWILNKTGTDKVKDGEKKKGE